jgi:hypothetical protein
MTLRMPGVPYLGPPDTNWGGSIIRPPAGMVVHIAEGSYQGTIAWQQNPNADVSSYFVTSRAGDIAQMLDLDLMAWTQAAGNPNWIGVENEGFHTDAFTDAQINANARIFAWLRSVWPATPAQVTNSVNVGGLGWHGMGGVAWGNHPDCPGTPNVALLPTILARAVTNNTGGGEDVAQVLVKFSDAPDPAQVWLCDGMLRRRVAPADLAAGHIGNDGTHNGGMLGNLGNGGKVFTSAWAARDSWGVEYPPVGGGTGGGGPSLEQITAAVREQLDATKLGKLSG